MTVKEYINLKNELIEFLKVADKEDYDAAFYFIGQIDFDQDDEKAIEAVADIVLMKATKGKINSYRGTNSLQECSSILSSYQEIKTEKIHKHTVDRTSREREARARGFVYIPNSKEFEQMTIRAMLMPTYAQIESINTEKDDHKRNTFSQQFISRLVEQVSNPIEEIGVGWLIFGTFVIIVSILSCIN